MKHLRTISGVRGYSVVALFNPQNPINLGAALRAAGCFGAAMVVSTGATSPGTTDTMKVHRHLPLIRVEDLKSAIPYDCIPVAVDLVKGAIPLPEYEHPERAFYVFGPENGTLGRSVTSWCRDRVMVPMASGCMNLAATVNVVLYDRMLKVMRAEALQ